MSQASRPVLRITHAGQRAPKTVGHSTGLETHALVSAEAAGESDGVAVGPTQGAGPVEPANREGLPAEGRLPVVLGVPVPDGGDAVSGRVVREGDAIPAGTDEAGGANAASPSAPDPQLVCGAGDDFGGRCGGIQQQGETDHQKGVWISRTENAGNRLISSTWKPAGAGIHPQIQVRRHNSWRFPWQARWSPGFA